MQNFVGETALWRPKSGFPQFRSLNRRNSPQGRLLVSVDLTADEIPATGGHRRFVPFRESHKGWLEKVFSCLFFFGKVLSYWLETRFSAKFCIEPIKKPGWQFVTVLSRPHFPDIMETTKTSAETGNERTVLHCENAASMIGGSG